MAETQTRNEIINLRASRRQKELIDQAAELLDRTRSDFMLEVACREAQALLVDQTHSLLPETSLNGSWRRSISLRKTIPSFAGCFNPPLRGIDKP